MSLIDTHCHLDFNTYDDIRAAVIQEAAAAGVTRIINPGVDLPRTQAALALADTYPGVYAAVGIHPNSTVGFSDDMLAQVRALAAHPKVVAIGEIGIDYYWDDAPKDSSMGRVRSAARAGRRTGTAGDRPQPRRQRRRARHPDHLGTATLPAALKDRPGVLHSFSAPQAIADRGIELGFYLGFTGPVTFKNADDLRRIAARVPVDRILVETDGPFLTPHPYRGKRPNKPAYVRLIAERIAALHNLPDEEFFAQSTANAERLFALPPTE